MKQRDPKTGRFISSGTKAPKLALSIGSVLKRVLRTELEVYDKKDVTATKPSKMRPGAEVSLEMIDEKGPTGTHLVRVKKENSNRVFYTMEEKVTAVLS